VGLDVFSPELREKAEEIVGRYPGRRSALLPLLHLVQHQDGYVTADGIAARRLESTAEGAVVEAKLDVGKGSVVGASTVARGRYQDRSVIVGNPARVARAR
jgi:hypothetical protein